jgi:hypothetical protein
MSYFITKEGGRQGENESCVAQHSQHHVAIDRFAFVHPTRNNELRSTPRHRKYDILGARGDARFFSARRSQGGCRSA